MGELCDWPFGHNVRQRYCMHAGLPPQPAKPSLATAKYVALASGLCIGEPAVDVPKTMLLMDWVKGLFGDADQCKDVVRMVICGALRLLLLSSTAPQLYPL